MLRKTPVTQPVIKTITSLAKLFTTLRAGDSVYFDLDDTLLISDLHKFTDTALATEKDLANELKRLQAAGVTVYGLTARPPKYAYMTIKQLQSLDINLTYIIYAPSARTGLNTTARKGAALNRHLYKRKDKESPKRIVVIDDLEMQLQDIARECADYPLQLYHYVRPQQVLTHTKDNHTFPDTLNDYTCLMQLSSSSRNTHLLENQYGDKLVLKHSAHAGKLKIEILCNCIYSTLGVPVPKIAVYNRIPNSVAIITGLRSTHGTFQVMPLTEGTHDKKDEKKIRQTARNHFIALALLGNIHATNIGKFGVDKTGKVNLTGTGTNFLFDESGAARLESPDLLSELDSLRDPKKNADSYHWFGDLSADELATQARDILAIQHELATIIWDVSEKLDISHELREQFISVFARRLSVLADRFHIKEQVRAQPDKTAIPGKTAAGILTYSMIGGKPHVLFSQRTSQTGWDIFGGNSDTDDTSLLHTAIREVAEGSNDALQFNEQTLRQCPSHDLVSINHDGTTFTYRMYLARHTQINANHGWVAVEDLIYALTKRPVIVDGQASCEVTLANNQGTVPLDVQLHRMLTQQPVMAHLQRLTENKDLKPTHTRSYYGKLTPSRSQTHIFDTPKHQRQQTVQTYVKHSAVIRELKDTQPRTASKENPRHLVNAIINNDANAINLLFSRHPQWKKLLVRTPDQQAELMSVFHMMLFQSSLAADVIAMHFGSNWKDSPSLRIENGYQLASILDRLPDDEIVSYALKYRKIIKNDHQLAAILLRLPDEARLSFVTHQVNENDGSALQGGTLFKNRGQVSPAEKIFLKITHIQ